MWNIPFLWCRKKNHAKPSCYCSNCSGAFRYCIWRSCYFRWPSCYCSNCSWAFCYCWNCSQKVFSCHSSTMYASLSLSMIISWQVSIENKSILFTLFSPLVISSSFFNSFVVVCILNFIPLISFPVFLIFMISQCYV